MVDATSQVPWSDLREEAVRAGRAITVGQKPFQLTIGWPKTYELLLASAKSDTTPESGLLSRALEDGRIMLAAEAGSGKTWLLARLIDLAIQSSSALPALVLLRNLTADSSRAQTAGRELMIRHLLDNSVPRLSKVVTTPGNVPQVLLLVDGLNEIARGDVGQVISAIDEIGRRYPFISIIATDRLVRRPIDLDRWSLATILPLDEAEVRRVWQESAHGRSLPTAPETLNRPFLLGAALASDVTSTTQATTILEQYFHSDVGLTQAALADLADVAFDAYAIFRAATMPTDWLRQRVNAQVYTQLIDSGTLRENNSQASFTHHLFHDFLAALSLSHREQQWDRDAFDAVTLNAASFDALPLAVGELPDAAKADLLVRRIYDWSYYGASYALVQGSVSQEMYTAILAMLGDKRWDIIRATVTQVTDALRHVDTQLSRQLLRAKSRAELFPILRAIESTQGWFADWVALFTTPDGSTADVDLVDKLRSLDSIESWTLANVLRRCHLTEAGTTHLLSISADQSPVIRWRAVHVLGAHPSERAFSAVRSLLQDDDRWVRYGAIRASIEIAALTTQPTLRTQILSAVLELVEQNRLDYSMGRELVRSLDVDPPPNDWADVITPLIQQLTGQAKTLEEQGALERLMASIALRIGG